eukprot:90902_1
METSSIKIKEEPTEKLSEKVTKTTKSNDIKSKQKHNLKILKQNAKNKRPKKPIESDIDFNECYAFEATCPFKECDEYNKTIFKSQQEYQKHHGLKHETRDKFRNNLVWKCPQCEKQCSSFYNFSAHVSMHRELCKPPWICTLKPMKHGKLYNDKRNINICGKRSSTKNNLISHIRSVHKLHVIGYKQERNGGAHKLPTSSKKRDNNSFCRLPPSKRIRLNQETVLLKTYNNFNNPIYVVNNNNKYNHSKEPVNVFPGFNHNTCNTGNGINNSYDNITVNTNITDTSVPTPPSIVDNINGNMNHNNHMNGNMNHNNNNQNLSLPSIQQLKNLCMLLNMNNNNNTNDNNGNMNRSNVNLRTVMNCINYIKNSQQNRNRHQSNCGNMNKNNYVNNVQTNQMNQMNQMNKIYTTNSITSCNMNSMNNIADNT